MKMIGMSLRSAATRFCRSRPLRSGSETSSTRQLGTNGRGRAMNSSADANVSTCQPTQRISDSSDSRTEMSSSTTNTIGAPWDIERLDSRPCTLDDFISTPLHAPNRAITSDVIGYFSLRRKSITLWCRSETGVSTTSVRSYSHLSSWVSTTDTIEQWIWLHAWCLMRSIYRIWPIPNHAHRAHRGAAGNERKEWRVPDQRTRKCRSCLRGSVADWPCRRTGERGQRSRFHVPPDRCPHADDRGWRGHRCDQRRMPGPGCPPSRHVGHAVGEAAASGV